MSLFGSIGKALKSVAGSVVGKIATSVIPGVGPIAGTLIGTAVGSAISGGGGGGGKLPPVRGLPALPAGGGKIVGLSSAGVSAMAGAGAIAGEWLYDKFGNPVRKKRRRRKGITPKDLSSFKRVARLIDKFAAPVHHLRKSSFKSK